MQLPSQLEAITINPICFGLVAPAEQPSNFTTCTHGLEAHSISLFSEANFTGKRTAKVIYTRYHDFVHKSSGRLYPCPKMLISTGKSQGRTTERAYPYKDKDK